MGPKLRLQWLMVMMQLKRKWVDHKVRVLSGLVVHADVTVATFVLPAYNL